MLQKMVKPPRPELALFFLTALDQLVHLCCQVSESCFHEALQHGAGELERDGAGQKIKEGATLFGLAQEALDMLRREDVSTLTALRLFECG
ncbi:MAG: hypothetical protein LQ339_007596 [Xanthoria mediterranea]|nr:MAG: hypothetical protein LQ339_007596 [Xanthoria mediterranea]